jgi:hypothetical protein
MRHDGAGSGKASPIWRCGTQGKENMKMLKMAAGVAALGVVASASAQLDVHPANLTFRAGFVLPVDSALRNFSKTFFGVGVDYTLPNQFLNLKNSESYISLDWFGRSSNGVKGNVFPIAFNQRFWLGQNSSSLGRYGTPYATFGIGAAIIDVGQSSTKLLLRGGLGVELGSHLCAEAILTLTDKSTSGVRANAVGIYVGYRF